MIFKSILISSVFGALLAVGFSGNGKDPLGQVANYDIDKNPARTSSMIKSGTVKVSVVKFNESTSVGPSYDVNIDYKFKISLMGDQNGTEQVAVEKEFFTEEFLIKLRKEKHYEGAYFKADHLGFADAKNMDGKFYPNCDKILLYDMKEPPHAMTDLLASALDVPRADIQDLKALVHIFPGIPVLGGVKIDVSGVYSGMNVKAGGDFNSK